MKAFFIIVLVLFQSLSFADERAFLATYFDCMSSTNFLSNGLPVFTKINGKRVKRNYSAGAYTRGLEISLSTDQEGNITKFHLGEKISATPADFENGIEFGVIRLTAHTIQLVDFDPRTGGVLDFGFLKDVGAKKIHSKIARAENLNEYYTSLYGSDWGSYQIRLSKDQRTNEWKIKDDNSENVKAIFGMLKMKNKFLVHGISEMHVVTEADEEILKPTRRMINVNGAVCEI